MKGFVPPNEGLFSLDENSQPGARRCCSSGFAKSEIAENMEAQDGKLCNRRNQLG